MFLKYVMGNSEEGKASKMEKSSSPAVDQNSMHVYPDWSAMQAYYGPRFAVPPFMNSGVGSPHAPPAYMWGPPQSLMPPYGAPYAAFYAHGGVYAHPGVPLAGTPPSVEAQVKSSENTTDGSFTKKLKEFDGLTISIGNGNSDGTENGTDHRMTDSDETGGSSDGSNGVEPRNGKKRSGQRSPDREDGRAHKRSSLAEVDRASEKTMDVNVIPSTDKPVKAMENINSALVKETSLSSKSSPTSVPLSSIPNESWMQNERELKRERRKQSNRESARRSRLRKQAETEELSVKVQALNFENLTLKSEINKLMQSSEKLKRENAALLEKLKDVQVGQPEEPNLHKIDDLGTVNLLARVNNDVANDEGDSYDNRSSPGAKLHQLLDTSPRTDAVAAG